jgi:hypothetical protein
MAQVTLHIDGVKAVLQELYYLDRTLHRQITATLRTEAKPLVDEASRAFPADPLTRWTVNEGAKRSAGGFPSYNPSSARRGVRSKVGGRRNQRTGEWPILRLQQTDAGGAVYDMSGRSTGGKNSFVPNLEGINGNASRVMWPAVEKGLPLIERLLQAAIDLASAEVTRRFAAGETSQRRAQSTRSQSFARDALGRFGVR